MEYEKSNGTKKENMNRREFLKLLAYGVASIVIPISFRRNNSYADIPDKPLKKEYKEKYVEDYNFMTYNLNISVAYTNIFDDFNVRVYYTFNPRGKDPLSHIYSIILNSRKFNFHKVYNLQQAIKAHKNRENKNIRKEILYSFILPKMGKEIIFLDIIDRYSRVEKDNFQERIRNKLLMHIILYISNIIRGYVEEGIHNKKYIARREINKLREIFRKGREKFYMLLYSEKTSIITKQEIIKLREYVPPQLWKELWELRAP